MHLVDGLLIALLNIDEVIQVIRTSDDAAAAKERLMAVFDLSRDPGPVHPGHPAAPADPLRPAGAGARARDAAARDRRADRDPGLRAAAARAGLGRAGRRQREVRDPPPHGAAGGQRRGPDGRGAAGGGRRSVHGAAVLGGAAGPDGQRRQKTAIRSGNGSPAPGRQRPRRRGAARRARRDRLGGAVHGARHDRRGDLAGPADPARRAGAARAAAERALPRPVRRRPGQRVPVAAGRRDRGRAGGGGRPGTGRGRRAGGRHRQGVVKRVAPDYPQNAAEFEVIALKDGDRVVGAVQLADEAQDLVFVTSDAQLLRFGGGGGAPAGPGRRRDGRDQAGGPGLGGLVRRRRPGRARR